MSKIDTLVAAINNAVKTNGSKAITGAILQTVLDSMVGTLTQINGLLNVNQVNNRSDAYASAATARGAVPSDIRADGLVIAYKLSSGWIIEQNIDISGTWSADSSWNVVGPIAISTNSANRVELTIGKQIVVVPSVNELETVWFNLGNNIARPIIMEPGYIICNGAAGTVVDLTPVFHSTYKCSVVDCNEKEVVYIQGKGGNADRLYCFIDAENKVISSATANMNQETPLRLTAPLHTAKLIINDETASRTSYIGEVFNKQVVGRSAFINVNILNERPGAYDSNAAARTAVDEKYRQLGCVLCYLLSTGWYMEKYVGSSVNYWNNDATQYHLWDKIFSTNDIDTVPIEDSDNLVPSGGIYKALAYNNYLEEKISLENNKIEGWAIQSDNRWYSVGSPYACRLIPLDKNFGFLRITAGNRECIYALLAVDLYENAARAPFAAALPSRYSIQANKTVDVEIPEDANFLYLYDTGSGGVSYLPTSVSLFYKLDNIVDSLKKEVAVLRTAVYNLSRRSITADGRDIPQNIGENNMYKKAKQMMEIPWNCLSDLPQNGNDASMHVLAGQYNGFPYSSVKEKDKFIGFHVSFKTFMTAAHNPYSLLYTEDTFGERSHSEYGFTYHGINCGPYFGVVCNVFALFPLGFDIPWNTQEFDYLEQNGLLEKIVDQSAAGLQIGDIIWEPGHGNLITDIYRDERGIPTAIYWSESALPQGTHLIRTNVYNKESFESRLAQRGGIIYRFTELYDNINYSPSEFVAVEDEATPAEYDYNDDICTFAGDCSCFFEGDIIFINYNKGSYTQMEIYKDDELLSTKTLQESSIVHKMDLTDDNLSYGKYKARLVNSNEVSGFTYFEIVDCNVTYADIDGISKRITFNSHNGQPLYLDFVYQSGKCRGMYKITEQDIEKGYVDIMPRKILNEQYNLGSDSISVYDEPVYVKVFFKGDYGIVRNEPILTDLY